MIKFLKDKLTAKQVFDAPITPDHPFVVVGDVHGCNAQLSNLLAMLRSDAPGLPLVFVGDYLDRGPDSAGVLRTLHLLETENPDVVCLKGNHEAMALEFIDFPESSGRNWLKHGGAQTLDSYGLALPDPEDDTEMVRARDAFLDKAGTSLVTWLRDRPVIWQNGNVVVSHAGGDPSQPIEPRRGHGYLWGHRDFLKKPRQDGLWMAHGHYVTKEASAKTGRIAVDTGAYLTGHLTAAIVEDGNVRFLST